MFKHSINNSNSVRIFVFLFLFFPACMVFSQSVWSGDAAVDAAEFKLFDEDIPLAGASSSFTRNTKVEVTNTQNGKKVEITIVKRSPKPGVFLILSREAGKALGIQSDLAAAVQVSVVSENKSTAYDELNSKDPDINPSITVPDIDEEADDSEGLPVETVTEDVIAFDSTVDDFFGDELLSVPLPVDGQISEEAEPVPEESIPEEELFTELPPEEELIVEDPIIEEVALEEPVVEELVVEEPVVEELVVEESVVEEPVVEEPVVEDLTLAEPLAEEPVIEESMALPKGDNVIYFLTPSDFRPPSGPVLTEEKEEEIVPVLVDRNALQDYIVEQLNNGSSYIQLGAYSTAESVYEEIKAIASRYPMLVWTEDRGGITLYKLLIGPLTQDETGVLSYRFRDSGYADLFLYKP